LTGHEFDSPRPTKIEIAISNAVQVTAFSFVFLRKVILPVGYRVAERMTADWFEVGFSSAIIFILGSNDVIDDATMNALFNLKAKLTVLLNGVTTKTKG
jgi:hypothetical protein